VLDRHGISLRSIDDVMLMSYVLDAGRSGHGLEDLSQRHLGHDMLNMADIVGRGGAGAARNHRGDARCSICAETCDVSLRVWRLLSARLVAEGVVTVYQTLERPLVPVLARMEQRASRSTPTYCRGCRATSHKRRARLKPKFRTSRASRSIRAARNKSPISCSAK